MAAVEMRSNNGFGCESGRKSAAIPIMKNNNNNNNNRRYYKSPSKSNNCNVNNNKNGNNNNNNNNSNNNRGQQQPKRNNSNNNNNNNRKFSLPETSMRQKQLINRSPPNNSTLKEVVTVDHVSPAEDGQIYLYVKHPLKCIPSFDLKKYFTVDPNTVNFTPKRQSTPTEQDDDDCEEELELWEKLCDESRVHITFDSKSLQISKIIALHENDPEPLDIDSASPDNTISPQSKSNLGSNVRSKSDQKKVAKPEPTSPAEWVRGRPITEAPRRSNNNNNNNHNKSPPKNNNHKSNQQNKVENNAQDKQRERRDSLPSVRVMSSPSMTGKKEDTESNHSTATSYNNDSTEMKEMREKMERLEKMNEFLMEQLQEAKAKIRMLEGGSKSLPRGRDDNDQ